MQDMYRALELCHACDEYVDRAIPLPVIVTLNAAVDSAATHWEEVAVAYTDILRHIVLFKANHIPVAQQAGCIPLLMKSMSAWPASSLVQAAGVVALRAFADSLANANFMVSNGVLDILYACMDAHPHIARIASMALHFITGLSADGLTLMLAGQRD